MATRSIGVRLPDWMIRQMVNAPTGKSERIRELITKGYLYEKMESVSNSGGDKTEHAHTDFLTQVSLLEGVVV